MIMLDSPPATVAPRIFPFGDATTLANPSVSPSITAASTSPKPTRYTRQGISSAIACASVIPTPATTGSVNVAHGIVA